MTVIVIIGIMTALIIPEMKGSFEDSLLRSTARELVNAFEIASSRAVSQNQNLRVHVNTIEGRYAIEHQVQQYKSEEFAPLRDVLGGTGDLDKRIAIEIHRPDEENAKETPENAQPVQHATENNGEAISFFPDGTAEAAIVLLKDRAGFRLALRINPITARVNVLELERE